MSDIGCSAATTLAMVNVGAAWILSDDPPDQSMTWPGSAKRMSTAPLASVSVVDAVATCSGRTLHAGIIEIESGGVQGAGPQVP